MNEHKCQLIAVILFIVAGHLLKINPNVKLHIAEIKIHTADNSETLGVHKSKLYADGMIAT